MNMNSFYFVRFLVFLAYIFISASFGVTKDSNQCLKDKPKLSAGQTLNIEIFYVTDEADQIIKDVCCVKKKFGKLVYIKYVMGALVTTTSNGISCGPSGCDKDRDEACQYLLIKNFDNECGDVPDFDMNAFWTCYYNHQSDDLLIKNGKRRVYLGIPDNKIPALAFNGKYDPCAKNNSCDVIKTYICELYQNAVAPCKN